MSMSIDIIGFRPPDDKWKNMKAVWEACERASTEVPDEVIEFFNGIKPDNNGLRVDLEEQGCAKEYQGLIDDGYQINISKLPKNITKIRFCISY